MRFVGNRAGGAGGGLRVINGHQLTIEDSAFVGNSGINGGAVDKEQNGGPVTIINTLFDRNSAFGRVVQSLQDLTVLL